MEQLTAAQQAAELNKKNLFATYTHVEAEFVEPDHAIFKLEIRPESKNPYGIVHGGAIYTMQMAGFARVGFISEPPPGSAVVRM